MQHLAKIIGYEYALQNLVLPVRLENQHLWVALTDLTNNDLLTDLAALTGMYIMPVFATAEEIREGINQDLAPDAIADIATRFVALGRENEDTPPVVQFVDSVIESATALGASDIHIEPFDNKLRVRFRIDGYLHTHNISEITLHKSVISHLKVKSGMDISEKRRPQDGRFSLYSSEPSKDGRFSLHSDNNLARGKIEFRISVLPTVFGEKAAIRILYDGAGRLSKTDIGFLPEDIAIIEDLLARPYGAVFVTGPTGSGKSTTLTCFLDELNKTHTNIVTAEDPVENPLPGVNHVAAERGDGISFAGILRNILRQDPDVIMVGEIRDEETARIAIRAAITGHIVLSTLHTNDAAGVIERLLDMGIEPYLAASAINGIISQRLVRRVCKNCKQPASLTVAEAGFLGLDVNTKVFKGVGCNACFDTGYRGRMAVYELVVVDEEIRRNMSETPYPFAAKLRKQSRLREIAAKHVLEGSTTAEEVMKVL